MRKRGQGSDLSYTEEKNGNNTLVTIKKEEKFEVEKVHMDRKGCFEFMHMQSLVDPSGDLFIFDPCFYFCCRSLRTRRRSALNAADKLF